MTSPRILFLSHTGSLGGAELSMIDIARHHRRQSTFVLFEDGPFRKRLEAAGVDVRVLSVGRSVLAIRRGTGLLPTLMAIPALVRLVNRIRVLLSEYDLVYAASQKAFVAGSLAGALANRPVFWHLHDLVDDNHFSRLNRWLCITLANAFAQQVVVNSYASLDSFVASGGRAENASVVYYGLDPTPFTEDAPSGPVPLRTQLGIPDNRPVAGVFSRLAEWKGQHVLIEALASTPDFHAVFVGDALFDGDEVYKHRLLRLAEEVGVSDRTHFLGFRDDVPALMRAVDVVVHTSTAPEPFGRVIVEGMLAHRPVIATKAGGAVEIIRDGDTGFLVPPGDAPALADALHKMSNSPKQVQSLASAGRADATARFTVNAMNRSLDALIQALVVSSDAAATAHRAA
jgi:glycosyltransferase involved in cell wall biosynthesis